MFRRKEDTMAPDHYYEADLKKLGFFVNDVGQIRMIEAPDKEYAFHSTSDDRVNEMRREAIWECARQETEKRLSALNINPIYLPGFTTVKPNGPHVPILAPSPEILRTRKRIIVLVNDAMQDLGILAYRHIQHDPGLNGGSVVNFVKEMIKRSAPDDAAAKYDNIFEDGFWLQDDEDTPALVVLNSGQLLYSHKYNRAMTMRSWSAMPRKTVAHDMIRIHDVENRVEGHRDAKQHVKSVFDNIICNSDRVAPNAEVYVIAIEGGTEYILDLLEQDLQKYGSRITAMALIHSLVHDSQVKDPNIRAFLHQRAREWRYSDLSITPNDCIGLPENYETPEDSPSDAQMAHIAWNENVSQGSSISSALYRLAISKTSVNKVHDTPTPSTSDTWSSTPSPICPTFASGPDPSAESILPDFPIQHAILHFFEQVAQNPTKYHNPPFKPYTAAPKPSPDHPLAFDPTLPNIPDFSALSTDMSAEQITMVTAKEKLKYMNLALKAVPSSLPHLQQGRSKLVERIAMQEARIEKLKMKIDADADAGDAQAQTQQATWSQQKEGEKVKFAGGEVDRKLLEAAGLMGGDGGKRE